MMSVAALGLYILIIAIFFQFIRFCEWVLDRHKAFHQFETEVGLSLDKWKIDP